MSDQVKNIIIGLFVVAAISIVIFIILFLHPSTGDEGQVLYVRFADVDKINVGTRVTLAGKAIGEVVDIKDITNSREGPSDEYGHVYIYELKLLIDSHIKIYRTDLVSSRTSGLLGEKSVQIMPQEIPHGEKADLVKPGDILYAVDAGTVEDTLKEFKEVASKVDLLIDQLSMTLQDINKEELIQKIASTAQNLSEITSALNQPDELSSIIHNLQTFTSHLATRLPASWDMVDETLSELDATTANTHNITSTVKRMVDNVSHGEGTIGKLLVTNDLNNRITAFINNVDKNLGGLTSHVDLRMSSLFSKGETVLNDINHYGILYHLDKGWQRLRARRLNLMDTLSTPQQFQNYFNDEIDQISTSLARVSMVLEKVEFCSPYCCSLLEDPEYSKVFSELLRRVSGMEETLKLYNQQTVDVEVQKTQLIDNREECR
jgi:phospholipid/cholesterol/gamma-HCH transport system substrate-binding protein